MRSQRGTKRSETAAEGARGAPPSVRYDVAVGLERHRKLVAAGTPLPEWAEQLPPTPRPGYLRSWRWWLAGALTVATGAFLRWPSGQTTSRPAADVAAEHSPAAGAVPDRAAPLRSGEPERDGLSAARARGADALSGPPSAPPGTGANVTGENVERAEAAAPGALDALRARGSARLDQPPPLERARAAKLQQRPLAPAASAARGQRTRDRRAKIEPGGEAAFADAVRGQQESSVESPQDREEMRQLAQAEALLATRPAAALRLVRAGEARFPRGYFRQERRYLEVMALVALGQLGEARAHAYWFLQDYPGGPYRKRVELVLEQDPL
jgi:hypothetical protein